MELSVFERLILLTILPKEGDITTIKIVHDLRIDLSFQEDEIKRLQLHINEETNNWEWLAAEDIPKEIKIGDKGRSIIVKAFENLSSHEGFTEEHLPLYERFTREYCTENQTEEKEKDSDNTEA